MSQYHHITIKEESYVMARSMKTMDGNNAAAYVSYAFTEVAGIYPITPSSPMADYVDSGLHRARKTSSVLPLR